MITPLTFSYIAGTSLASVLFGSAFFLVFRHNNTTQNFVYAVSTSTPAPAPAAAPVSPDTTPQPVACSITGTELVDNKCFVALATLPTDKKWIDSRELSETLKHHVTKTELSTADKVFRIEVNKQFFDSLDWATVPKNIEVLDKSDHQTKITTLKPIFGFIGNRYYHPKIQSFLAEPDWFPQDFKTKQDKQDIYIQSSDDVKCSFVNRLRGRKDCKIFEFSTLTLTKDDEYGAPSKSDFTTTSAKVQYHKNYLITFTNPADAVSVSRVHNRTLFYLKKITTNTNNYYREVEFRTWTPTILQDIGSSKYLFILK